MEFLHEVWNFFLNLLRDTGGTLDMLVTEYGLWVYAILFLIIFCETGLVVTPFLPGDSLLFLAGAIAVRPDNPLHIYYLVGIPVSYTHLSVPEGPFTTSIFSTFAGSKAPLLMLATPFTMVGCKENPRMV